MSTNEVLPSVALTDVPETMLWTLHNRASEAMRPDGVLHDPDAVRIYRAIDYDYGRSFGRPDGSHAIRSRMFDDVVRPWLAAHPGGTVVELACGLETQCRRCDDGRVQWLCVDVPEAIEVRQRFLPPNGRCRHIGRSALDLAWLDEVDATHGVFVTAQGLFMYFEQADVQLLLTAMARRLPGVEIMFDTIPRWFSRKTLKGYRRTDFYQAPPMPWGIDRNEIEPVLRRWIPGVKGVSIAPYGCCRGALGMLLPLFSKTPGLRGIMPIVVHMTTFAGTAPRTPGRSHN